MRDIKYYDNISAKYISVKVNNAVAENLKAFYYDEKEQKRQIAKNETSIDPFKNSEEFLIDNTSNPYEVLEQKEGLTNKANKEIGIELLKKSLKKLKKEEWFIIKKIFWQNYKKIEISRKYNIKPSLITYRYQNATNKLKNYILENEKLNLRLKK